MKLSRKSLLTDDIAEADAKRDSLYSGYKKAVQGFLNLPRRGDGASRESIEPDLKDYGIDPKMQLDRETGMLINFIADWRRSTRRKWRRCRSPRSLPT